MRTGNILRGVSCATASRCVAVGSFEYGPSSDRSLIETFDGTKWSITANPNEGDAAGILYGVSCPRVTFCVAVGNANTPRYGPNSGPIIKTWDGTRWTLTPSPNLAAFGGNNALFAVSCTSAAFCMAVGSMNLVGATQTIMEKWDGIRWSITPSPTYPGYGMDLDGVSCVSTTSCVAVGASGGSTHTVHTLVETWDGASWSRTRSPDARPPGGIYPSSFLSSVSCVSSTSCVAVGTALVYDVVFRQRPLVETWDGTRWSLASEPRGRAQRELTGVWCTNAYACVAVGSDTSAALHPGSLIVVGATPPRSVTVSLTAAEDARLQQMAKYLHQSVSQTQKSAVYALAFVIGLGPRTITPVTLPPSGSAAIHTTVWPRQQLAVIDAVATKYAVHSVAATRVSLYFLSYILALGGH